MLLPFKLITLCLLCGVSKTEEFLSLLLHSFWHCSFTSFRNKDFTAFLNLYVIKSMLKLLLLGGYESLYLLM